MTDTCKARAFTCALVAIAILLTMLSPLAQAQVEVRLKDVGKLVGVTTNQLIGYGIVTGLAGTGDRSSELRDRSLANMMSHFGLTAEPYDIKSRNTAAVVVTAKLPAFVKVGDQIDATLSSLFDAKSLEGGILLMTHLQGADGRTYAVAQGAVSIGGSNSMTGRGDFRNHATVATIPGGAIVQAEVPSVLWTSTALSCIRSTLQTSPWPRGPLMLLILCSAKGWHRPEMLPQYQSTSQKPGQVISWGSSHSWKISSCASTSRERS